MHAVEAWRPATAPPQFGDVKIKGDTSSVGLPPEKFANDEMKKGFEACLMYKVSGFLGFSGA